MKDFKEYNGIGFEFYKGIKNGTETSYDILIFDYKYGLNSFFIRNDFDNTFYECKGGVSFSSGYKSSGNGKNIFYESFRRDFDFYRIEDKAFLKIGSFDFLFMEKSDIDLSKETYRELPERRVLQNAYITKNDDIILISNLEFHHSYDNYLLHIGDTKRGFIGYKPEVERYRDGGTTYYKTNAGTLYTPTSFNKNLKPTWDEIEVKESEDLNKLKISLDELGIFLEKFEN